MGESSITIMVGLAISGGTRLATGDEAVKRSVVVVLVAPATVTVTPMTSGGVDVSSRPVAIRRNNSQAMNISRRSSRRAIAARRGRRYCIEKVQ
jgi:hypothetical protein